MIFCVVMNFVLTVIEVKPIKIKIGNPDKLKDHKTPIYEMFKSNGYYYVGKYEQNWVSTGWSILGFFIFPYKLETYKWGYKGLLQYYIKDEDLVTLPITRWTLIEAKEYYEEHAERDRIKYQKISDEADAEEAALKRINDEFKNNYVGNYAHDEDDDYPGFC